MRLPNVQGWSENERNRALERADRANVKKDKENRVSGSILIQSPDGNWWRLTVDNSGTPGFSAA